MNKDLELKPLLSSKTRKEKKEEEKEEKEENQPVFQPFLRANFFHPGLRLVLGQGCFLQFNRAAIIPSKDGKQIDLDMYEVMLDLGGGHWCGILNLNMTFSPSETRAIIVPSWWYDLHERPWGPGVTRTDASSHRRFLQSGDWPLPEADFDILQKLAMSQAEKRREAEASLPPPTWWQRTKKIITG